MSPATRLKVLLFLAGYSGALGVLFLLLSFGTEYWLLASESCGPVQPGRAGTLGHGEGHLEVRGRVMSFHEGLFWRCSFSSREEEEDSVWNFWITNQPSPKVCVPAYLFPFPVSEPMGGSLEPDSAIIYRTFWSIFLLLGVITVVIGGFVAITAAPLASHRLYKVGGALLLTGGLCLLAVLVMYVMWVQALDTLERYAARRQTPQCPLFRLSVRNGPSFLSAPVAVFFCLLAGLLSILIGRSLRTSQDERLSGRD